MAATGAGSGIGNPLTIIEAGDSLPFVFDRGGESVDGWTCELNVTNDVGSTPEISRTIALDSNDQWSGFLTSTETAGLLSTGIYRMVAVLVEETTDEREEIPVRFQLNDSWG